MALLHTHHYPRLCYHTSHLPPSDGLQGHLRTIRYWVEQCTTRINQYPMGDSSIDSPNYPPLRARHRQWTRIPNHTSPTHVHISNLGRMQQTTASPRQRDCLMNTNTHRCGDQKATCTTATPTLGRSIPMRPTPTNDLAPPPSQQAAMGTTHPTSPATIQGFPAT
jgi:hypothetical protein